MLITFLVAQFLPAVFLHAGLNTPWQALLLASLHPLFEVLRFSW